MTTSTTLTGKTVLVTPDERVRPIRSDLTAPSSIAARVAAMGAAS